MVKATLKHSADKMSRSQIMYPVPIAPKAPKGEADEETKQNSCWRFEMTFPWDESPDPVEAAVHFEAVKLSMHQNKDGYILKLTIHPNDVPDSLMRDWVGSRYMVAMVLMNDQNEPVIPHEKSRGQKAVNIAGALCRNEKFWAYAGVNSEDEAISWLHDTLNIESRSDLQHNSAARDSFFGIVGEFKHEMEK